MKADKHFTNELSHIKNNDIRNFVRNFFEKVPDEFWTHPASSGGKYHPASSQGFGGLVTHTKQVMYVAKTIIETRLFPLLDIQIDVILASCLLHDSWKYDGTSKWTVKNHGVKAHDKMILFVFDDDFLITRDWFQSMLACVLSHNGYFTKEFTGKFTIEQKIVHMADLIASRKYFVFDERML